MQGAKGMGQHVPHCYWTLGWTWMARNFENEPPCMFTIQQHPVSLCGATVCFVGRNSSSSELLRNDLATQKVPPL